MRAKNNAWHGQLFDLAAYAYDTGEMRAPPRNVVFKHSNLCNLACRMCSPESSTSASRGWNAELAELTGKTAGGIVRNFPDVVRFAEELRSIAPTLNQVSFSGGEPFADPAVIDTLVALQPWARQIQVYANTNLSRLRFGDTDVLELVGRFDRRILCISVDGPPALHGYIRPGLDVSRFVENLARLQRPRFGTLHVNVAAQLLNVLRLPETLDFVLHAIRPDQLVMSLATAPGQEFLDPRLLPSASKRQLSATYEAYRHTMSPGLYPGVAESALDDARGLLMKVERFTWSGELSSDAQWARAGRYYRALDRIHGTDIREGCPEIAALLQ